MSRQTLADVLPAPDPDTARRLIALLGAARPAESETQGTDSKTA